MGYLIAFGVVIAIYGIVAIITLTNKGLLAFVARLVTPPEHRRIGKFDESEGHYRLKSEGYSVTADWSSNAVSKLPKN